MRANSHPCLPETFDPPRNVLSLSARIENNEIRIRILDSGRNIVVDRG